MNHQDLAAQLRDDTERFAREYGDPRDAERQCVVDIDVANLRLVAVVIEKGDLKRAYRLVERLDTAVSEEISAPVWDALRTAGGGA